MVSFLWTTRQHELRTSSEVADADRARAVITADITPTGKTEIALSMHQAGVDLDKLEHVKI